MTLSGTRSRRGRSRQPAASTRSSAPQQIPLDTFAQGVSQQPDYLRRPGQGEEQENGWSSPVEGLRKRQPTLLRAELFADVPAIHADRFIVTADEVYYCIVIPWDGKWFLGLYDSTYHRVPVHVHGPGLSTTHTSYPDGDSTNWVVGDSSSYLALASYTTTNGYVLNNTGPLGLFLNREKVTAMKPDLSPSLENSALLFVQATNYEVEFKLTLDGQEYTYTTPKATDTNNKLSTSDVVTNLVNEINNGPNASNYTITSNGAVALIEKTSPGEIEIDMDDSFSNQLARTVYKSIVSLAFLPIKAPEGFRVKISSDPISDVDDRWLRFRRTEGGTGIGEGSWEETVAPDTPFQIDETTMPYILYRDAKGVFFFGPADGSSQSTTVNTVSYDYTFPRWGDRTVGDEDTAPDPDFIGYPIRDHQIFRSRYVVAAGSSVMLSEVDEIFNFFPDSTLQVLDTDPFSVRAYSETTTDINWLLAVDESLLAFSTDTQFSIRAVDLDVLTPRNAVILRISNINMNPLIRPRIAASNVLFASEEFGFTNLREFQYFDSTDRRLGLNLGQNLNASASTPKYVRGLADQWDVGETVDYAVMRTPEDTNTLYIYKYLFDLRGNSIQRTQAAWSKWIFSQRILNIFFDANTLVLFLSDPVNGVGLYTVNVDELQDLENPEIHLDRRIDYPECNSDAVASNDISATYDPIKDQTTFTLPYSVLDETLAVVRFDSGTLDGSVLGSTQSGNQIVCDLLGDHRGLKIAFGELYKFKYVLSKLYLPVQSRATGQIVGQLSGRTQVHNIEFNHFNTGRYTVNVERKDRSPTTYVYRARALGIFNNRLSVNELPLATGSFRVPVHSKSGEHKITLESDNWLPVTVHSAQWEGTYSNRSRRI